MTYKYPASPDVLGYKPGAILLALTNGTTDGLENVQAIQGQPFALMRAWQAATLSYVTLGVNASGALLTAGGAASTAGGSTSVDATLLPSTEVVGHVIVDSMPAVSVSGTTLVDANLTSAGSTRLVGQFTVANPTTSVTISNPTTSVTVSNPTTAVDLSSNGSTRLVGKVDINNPTTAVTVSNPTTAVTISPATPGSSNDYLWVRDVNAAGAGSTTVDANLSSAGSTKVVGTVNVSSGAILGAGSSANTIGSVALVAGTSANMLGSVAQSSGAILGASTAVIGLVAQGSGSSANAWYTQSIAFSSGNAARTSIATSVDVQIIAANANRKALIIASLSTAQTVAIGLTTGVMTTALANASLYLQANGYVLFGLSGGLPLYQGPVRGINITSTAVGGGVAVTEFT